MKEEISQQRCTIDAHGYTNNLPENKVSKANVDVVDKKVNSETKLSTREVCLPHGHPISRPEDNRQQLRHVTFIYILTRHPRPDGQELDLCRR